MDPLQLLRLQLVAPANCRVLIPPQPCDDFRWRSSTGWAARGSQCQQPQHPDPAGKVWAQQLRTHRSLTGRRAHTLAGRGVLANVLRDSRSRRLAASEVDHPSGDVNADERAVEQRSAKSTPRSTRLCGWPANPWPARDPNVGLFKCTVRCRQDPRAPRTGCRRWAKIRSKSHRARGGRPGRD